MAVTIKVACPVCPERLEYEHEEGEAWGIVNLTDYGTVELTAHDKGSVVGPHMRAHQADGSWARAVRQRAEWMAGLVKRLDELEAAKQCNPSVGTHVIPHVGCSHEGEIVGFSPESWGSSPI